MKKLKFTKKEYTLVKYIVLTLIAQLKKNHPKLIKFDSNVIHFMVYDVAEKEKLPITRGWYVHGPYVPIVDDILVDLGYMVKSEHQMYGNEKMLEKLFECECHKVKGELK